MDRPPTGGNAAADAEVDRARLAATESWKAFTKHKANGTLTAEIADRVASVLDAYGQLLVTQMARRRNADATRERTQKGGG